ncbi:unnamed protein product [Orchesella dallaii]
MQHVDAKTSFKFRKISKSAKLGVDETLQSFSNSDDDKPFGFHYEDSSNQQHLRKIAHKTNSRYEKCFKIYSPFLTHIFPDLTTISSNINPFLMGHIHYSDHSSMEWSLLTRNDHVVNILPKFGHHILSIKCNVIENRRDILPFSHFVSNLQHVPNLKRLEMKPYRDFNPLAYPVLPALPTTSYDFPPLPKLLLLNVNSVDGDRESISSFVLEMLKKYSQQLTAFTCRASLFTLASLNLEEPSTSFPNMKKFRLLATRSEIPAALNKLSNVSWRLERFHLEVSGSLNDRKLNPHDVLSKINKFHQSLVHLELNCQLEAKDNESEAGNEHNYRQMSKLKILITCPSNLKLGLFKRFLERSCLTLKEVHLLTNDGDFMMFREEGRWALEQIRSVDKVVFWYRKYVRREQINTKYTMRRTEAKTSYGTEDST